MFFSASQRDPQRIPGLIPERILDLLQVLSLDAAK